jgi:hypothetical protein
VTLEKLIVNGADMTHVIALKSICLTYTLHENIFTGCTNAFEVFLLITTSRDVYAYQHLNSYDTARKYVCWEM